VYFRVHQDGSRPNTGIPEILTEKQASVKSEYPAIGNEYPERASVVQQVCRVVGDTEDFTGCRDKRGGPLL
jgi:hypothetical protein